MVASAMEPLLALPDLFVRRSYLQCCVNGACNGQILTWGGETARGMRAAPVEPKGTDQRAGRIRCEQANNERWGESRGTALQEGGPAMPDWEKSVPICAHKCKQAALAPLQGTRRGHSPPPKSHRNNALPAPTQLLARIHRGRTGCIHNGPVSTRGSCFTCMQLSFVMRWLGSAATDLFQATLPNRNQLGQWLPQLRHGRLWGCKGKRWACLGQLELQQASAFWQGRE